MTPMTLEDQTATYAPEDAALRLGVEVSTLANWRWNGRGPRFVKCGGRVRYRLSDLARYLDEQTRGSTSDPGPSADEAGGR